MFNYHKENQAAATIAVYKRSVNIDFGVIETENENLVNYIEKPTFDFEVSMGVNILSSHVIKRYLSLNTKLDMPELILKLKDDGEKVLCFRDEGCYWLDIGRVDDYEKAVSEFENQREKFCDGW